jgi:hypothetical protein
MINLHIHIKESAKEKKGHILTCSFQSLWENFGVPPFAENI